MSRLIQLSCVVVSIYQSILMAKKVGWMYFARCSLKEKEIDVIERLLLTLRVSANTDRCCNFSFCPYNNKPLAGIGSHSVVFNQQRKFTCRPPVFPSLQKSPHRPMEHCWHTGELGQQGFTPVRHLELILLNGWGGNWPDTHSDT